MKVTTDACIQGAWTPTSDNEKNILDIGTGTGLLALMLAQKANNSVIDAIEYDNNAALQAKENFERSAWAPNLNAIHADVTEYHFTRQYDMVISNPPFFIDSLKNNSAAATNARHNATLQFDDLVRIAIEVLAPEGVLSILLPTNEFQIFTEIAAKNNLCLFRKLEIKHTPTSAVKRCVGLFATKKTDCQIEVLTIKEKEEYTDAFKRLLTPYYLYL